LILRGLYRGIALGFFSFLTLELIAPPLPTGKLVFRKNRVFPCAPFSPPGFSFSFASPKTLGFQPLPPSPLPEVPPYSRCKVEKQALLYYYAALPFHSRSVVVLFFLHGSHPPFHPFPVTVLWSPFLRCFLGNAF